MDKNKKIQNFLFTDEQSRAFIQMDDQGADEAKRICAILYCFKVAGPFGFFPPVFARMRCLIRRPHKTSAHG